MSEGGAININTSLTAQNASSVGDTSATAPKSPVASKDDKPSGTLLDYATKSFLSTAKSKLSSTPLPKSEADLSLSSTPASRGITTPAVTPITNSAQEQPSQGTEALRKMQMFAGLAGTGSKTSTPAAGKNTSAPNLDHSMDGSFIKSREKMSPFSRSQPASSFSLGSPPGPGNPDYMAKFREFTQSFQAERTDSPPSFSFKPVSKEQLTTMRQAWDHRNLPDLPKVKPKQPSGTPQSSSVKQTWDSGVKTSTSGTIEGSKPKPTSDAKIKQTVQKIQTQSGPVNVVKVQKPKQPTGKPATSDASGIKQIISHKPQQETKSKSTASNFSYVKGQSVVQSPGTNTSKQSINSKTTHYSQQSPMSMSAILSSAPKPQSNQVTSSSSGMLGASKSGVQQQQVFKTQDKAKELPKQAQPRLSLPIQQQQQQPVHSKPVKALEQQQQGNFKQVSSTNVASSQQQNSNIGFFSQSKGQTPVVNRASPSTQASKMSYPTQATPKQVTSAINSSTPGSIQQQQQQHKITSHKQQAQIVRASPSPSRSSPVTPPRTSPGPPRSSPGLYSGLTLGQIGGQVQPQVNHSQQQRTSQSQSSSIWHAAADQKVPSSPQGTSSAFNLAGSLQRSPSSAVSSAYFQTPTSPSVASAAASGYPGLNLSAQQARGIYLSQSQQARDIAASMRAPSSPARTGMKNVRI